MKKNFVFFVFSLTIFLTGCSLISLEAKKINLVEYPETGFYYIYDQETSESISLKQAENILKKIRKSKIAVTNAWLHPFAPDSCCGSSKGSMCLMQPVPQRFIVRLVEKDNSIKKFNFNEFKQLNDPSFNRCYLNVDYYDFQ